MSSSGWPPGPAQSGAGWSGTPADGSSAGGSAGPPAGGQPGWGGGATSAGWGSGGSGWGTPGSPGGAPATPGTTQQYGPGTGAPAWAAGGGSWNSSDSGSGTGGARPPLGWLWAALAGPLLGLALLFVSGWTWNVVGWAVAILVGLGLLVVFTTIDLRRRTNPWYLGRPGLVGALRITVAAAAIIVAGVHAYLLADYIARLDIWVS